MQKYKKKGNLIFISCLMYYFKSSDLTTSSDYLRYKYKLKKYETQFATAKVQQN